MVLGHPAGGVCILVLGRGFKIRLGGLVELLQQRLGYLRQPAREGPFGR